MKPRGTIGLFSVLKRTGGLIVSILGPVSMIFSIVSGWSSVRAVISAITLALTPTGDNAACEIFLAATLSLQGTCLLFSEYGLKKREVLAAVAKLATVLLLLPDAYLITDACPRIGAVVLNLIGLTY